MLKHLCNKSESVCKADWFFTDISSQTRLILVREWPWCQNPWWQLLLTHSFACKVDCMTNWCRGCSHHLIIRDDTANGSTRNTTRQETAGLCCATNRLWGTVGKLYKICKPQVPHLSDGIMMPCRMLWELHMMWASTWHGAVHRKNT